MTLKIRNPGAGRRQGFGLELVSQAGSEIEATVLTLENQRPDVVAWLAARANVALPTARVHAELFGIGGCR